MNRRSFLISAITLGTASVISARFYLKSDSILESWVENVVADHLASGGMEGMDITVFAHYCWSWPSSRSSSSNIRRLTQFRWLHDD